MESPPSNSFAYVIIRRATIRLKSTEGDVVNKAHIYARYLNYKEAYRCYRMFFDRGIHEILRVRSKPLNDWYIIDN